MRIWYVFDLGGRVIQANQKKKPFGFYGPGRTTWKLFEIGFKSGCLAIAYLLGDRRVDVVRREPLREDGEREHQACLRQRVVPPTSACEHPGNQPVRQVPLPIVAAHRVARHKHCIIGCEPSYTRAVLSLRARQLALIYVIIENVSLCTKWKQVIVQTDSIALV
jgi:hypothetical protein